MSFMENEFRDSGIMENERVPFPTTETFFIEFLAFETPCMQNVGVGRILKKLIFFDVIYV